MKAKEKKIMRNIKGHMTEIGKLKEKETLTEIGKPIKIIRNIKGHMTHT